MISMTVLLFEWNPIHVQWFETLLQRRTLYHGECRVWKGTNKVNGYFKIKYQHKTIYGHRLSFMFKHRLKQLRSTIQVRHMCGRRNCINPQHLSAKQTQLDRFLHGTNACLNPDQLELGTHKDNAMDRARDETHKSRGVERKQEESEDYPEAESVVAQAEEVDPFEFVEADEIDKACYVDDDEIYMAEPGEEEGEYPPESV